jgi:hypothetical protein
MCHQPIFSTIFYTVYKNIRHWNFFLMEFMLYALYLISATAMVVPCMMTLVSKLGSHDQKGTVMGIFRSLGALARAVGPVVASIGKL